MNDGEAVVDPLGEQGGGHGIRVIAAGAGFRHAIELNASGSGSPLMLYGPPLGSTGNDTTHLHLDQLTYGDDQINDYLLIIEDYDQDRLHLRWIEDWVASTKLATVATLPFTPAAGADRAVIIPFIRRDTL